jgi:ABC-type nitrate/sulfonate/bicarbonate transport system substrate-binding protein
MGVATRAAAWGDNTEGRRTPPADADFFISYTASDGGWAEWIAWHLEEAGFRVLVQAWDFVPGAHWMSRMTDGVRGSARVLAVLSNDYLRSVYGRSEWQAAFHQDPDGTIRKIIPVRVQDCARPDILDKVVSFDLFGLDAEQARTRLLENIRAALEGRAKPPTAPVYPGDLVPPAPDAGHDGEPPAFPGRAGIDGGITPAPQTRWAYLPTNHAVRPPSPRIPAGADTQPAETAPAGVAESLVSADGLELLAVPTDLLTGGPSERPAGRVVGRRTLLVGGSAAVATSAAAVVFQSLGNASRGPSSNATRATGPAPGGSLGRAVLASGIDPGIQFVGTYLANDRGYYKAEGFTDLGLIWQPPEDVIPGGAALAGVDAVDVVARLILQGSNTRVIGARYQRYPWGVVSLSAHPISTVDGLLGKRIAMSEGSQHIWRAFLRSNSIAETSVTSVVLGDAADQLQNGEVDGAISHVTDLAVRLRSDGFKVVTLLFADQGYPLVDGVYLTTKQNLTNQRTELKALLAAEIRGWTDALANPAAGLQQSMSAYDQGQAIDPQTEQARLQELLALMTSPETRENGLFTISRDHAAGTVSSINADNVVLGNRLAPITIDALFDLDLLPELYAERRDLPR